MKDRQRNFVFATLGLTGLMFLAPTAHAEFDECANGLRSNAAAAGISERTIARAMDDLQPNLEVIGFLNAQPEFHTPIWDYIAGLVDEERIAEGKSKLDEYRDAFARADEIYGVDAATVAAVWGVESNYGHNFGNRPILQSLATLSCFGRRQDYFRGEFIAALKIVDNGDADPEDFYGSWAGAFGQTQFMPSTFLKNAVSMDGTGHRDVIHSVPNAIGSTANFLKKQGWIPGIAWGYEVVLPPNYNGPFGRTNRQSTSYWRARGLTRIDGKPLDRGVAALLIPAGANGPAFLVSRNFDAIYSYNSAESYALAIALLSDRLRGKDGISTPWPDGIRGLSRQERIELQTLLQQRGYDVGDADGVLGTKSRRAIADYQARLNLNVNGGADSQVLDALREGK